MPEHEQLMVDLCRQNPAAFAGVGDDHDARRLEFLPTLIRALIAIDGPDWGMLIKRDQGDKIPCDIAVWRPTMEHVDVMTATGGSWQVRGVVPNPRWEFLAVDAPAPDVDPPAPAPNADIAAQLAALRARLDRIDRERDAQRRDVDLLVRAAAGIIGAFDGAPINLTLLVSPKVVIQP